MLLRQHFKHKIHKKISPSRNNNQTKKIIQNKLQIKDGNTIHTEAIIKTTEHITITGNTGTITMADTETITIINIAIIKMIEATETTTIRETTNREMSKIRKNIKQRVKINKIEKIVILHSNQLLKNISHRHRLRLISPNMLAKIDYFDVFRSYLTNKYLND